MMKTHHLVLCAAALAGLILSGCTTTTETTTTTQSQVDPAKRVHTQEELRKTGQSETGPALEKVDPAVQTSGPR
jgi:outer membrane murein-binding lipoprotein Lpp